MFGFDKIIDHARVEWAGSIESDQSNKIAELFRRKFDQQFAHAGTFQLENTLGVATAEQIKGLGIIHGDGVDIEIDADIFFDMFEGLIDYRQGFQTEKVELDKSGHLGMFHVILGQGLLVASPAGRQILGHWPGRDHHPGGMGGGMTGQSFEGL